MSRRDCSCNPDWTRHGHFLLVASFFLLTTAGLLQAAKARPLKNLNAPQTDEATRPAWQIQLKDGSRETLENLRFDDTKLTGRIVDGRRAGESATFDFNQIVRLAAQQGEANNLNGAEKPITAPQASPTSKLVLRDGSQIVATKLSSDGQVISLGEDQSIESRLVKEIRFAEPTEEQRAAWNEFAQAELSADLLVIKNSAGELTKIEGIVSEFSADSVMFEFSGQIIPVPMPRVIGVRFYSASVDLTEPVGLLEDRRGNRLNFVSLKTIHGESLEATLGTGTVSRLAVSEILSIDLSLSGTKFISDLKVLREEPNLSALPELSTLAGSRRTLLRRNAASQLPGSSIPPSLDFLSAGSVTFEVPEKFERFSGLVALQPEGSFCTPTRVEIWLEADRVWETELTEPQETRSFSIKLREDARLRLVVNPIGAFPVGTVVRWSSAELTRE